MGVLYDFIEDFLEDGLQGLLTPPFVEGVEYGHQHRASLGPGIGA